MSQSVKAQPHPNSVRPRITLNSDGRRHPLTNSLAVFALLDGLAAAPIGFIVAQHMLASVLGAAGLLVGLYAQLISATRNERMIIVTGLVGAFIGGALGVAHGGFAP
jgi:hypothetical protein